MNRPILFASIAALLALYASPARAESATYYFETPGTNFGIGALEFGSPASVASGWSGAGVREFDIFNFITLNLFIDAEDVSSDTGARLDSGQVTAGHEGITIGTDISPMPGQSTLYMIEGATSTVYGDWVATLGSVPEPSSLLTLALGVGGIFVLFGLPRGRRAAPPPARR